MAAKLRVSRSAISTPSTACASPSRTAPGASSAPHPTSRNWSWSSRALCRRRACATCSPRSMPSFVRARKSANKIRRYNSSAPAKAAEDEKSNFLINVDFERAGKHGAPGLQVNLHPRVAGDALPVELPVLARLVFDQLHEFRRIVDILQQANFGFAEHLVKRRRRLDHGDELARIRARQREAQLQCSTDFWLFIIAHRLHTLF